MARLLCDRDINVLGLTSNWDRANFEYSAADSPQITLRTFDHKRNWAIEAVIEDYQPDFIFNFAAKATGRGMFDEPGEMNRVNAGLAVEILEALRLSSRRDEITFCQASSSEMFGEVMASPQTEETALRPKSPYGAAKAYVHHLIGVYRANYGVRACSAILYNHESVRRSLQFVTKKIANGAATIKLGRENILRLGTLEAQRDWGYAPDYVDAMYRMVRAPDPEDFVIATGTLTSVRELCEFAFGHVGLDYRSFVVSEGADARMAHSVDLLGDASRAAAKLQWRAAKPVREIMVELVEHEIARLSSTGA